MMPSSRAEALAEVLWELKRVDKLACYSAAAARAGFPAGSAGRLVLATLVAVRRHWPHLQWWRLIPDDGKLLAQHEQIAHLRAAGYTLEEVSSEQGFLRLVDFDLHVYHWDDADHEEDHVPSRPAGVSSRSERF
ncbi:MAG: hypothetical protein KatS3mg114_0253 [Planctomycetaceae bacterium]|nr:MAG: hypothetical protein KatS3mg114_0253 [Planctomycetaceae bacterium]